MARHDTMAMLSSEFSSRLNLRTKTVGEDRIRKAKENNEDIAVLSMFLPGSAAVQENSRFRCALGVDCRLGDWRLATPGIIRLQHLFINLEFNFEFCVGDSRVKDTNTQQQRLPPPKARDICYITHHFDLKHSIISFILVWISFFARLITKFTHRIQSKCVNACFVYRHSIKLRIYRVHATE